MRLYILPISTRKTLLYCQRTQLAVTEKQTLVERAQGRAARLWAGWEKKESGWQKKIVEYGNYAFRRIPYEEWGLKSVPPLSARRKEDEAKGASKVEVIYPKSLLAMDRVPGILGTLSTEREGLHRRKLLWCLIGMPITAPFALVPVIPNLPFFYLVYRAWSHWRALNGGKHLQFLLKNNLLTMAPSPILDEVYAKQKQPLSFTSKPTTEAGAHSNPTIPASPEGVPDEGETMLLSQPNGKKMTQALDLPQLEVELERAIWQVEEAIKSQDEKEPAKTSTVSAMPRQSDDTTHEAEKKSK